MRYWKAAAAAIAMVLGAGQAQAVRYVEYTITGIGTANVIDQSATSGLIQRFSYTAQATTVFAYYEANPLVLLDQLALFAEPAQSGIRVRGTSSVRQPTTIDVSSVIGATYTLQVPRGTVSLPITLLFDGLTTTVTTREVTEASSISISVVAVPEPATWATLLLGFGAIGIGVRRRRVSYAAA